MVLCWCCVVHGVVLVVFCCWCYVDGDVLMMLCGWCCVDGVFLLSSWSHADQPCRVHRRPPRRRALATPETRANATPLPSKILVPGFKRVALLSMAPSRNDNMHTVSETLLLQIKIKYRARVFNINIHQVYKYKWFMVEVGLDGLPPARLVTLAWELDRLLSYWTSKSNQILPKLCKLLGENAIFCHRHIHDFNWAQSSKYIRRTH